MTLSDDIRKLGENNDGKSPDPTVLTTEQILREVENATKLLEAKIDGVEEVTRERFESVKTAFGLNERQRVEQKADCCEASTPVLCADLVWRPAGVLREGDELVAVEEYRGERDRGDTTPRRFQRAVVTSNSLGQDDLFKVTTTDGVLLCNAEHPWLSKQGSGVNGYTWVPTAKLKPGYVVARPVDTWDVDRSWEAGWLAGILDGEGCLYFTKKSDAGRLSIRQVVGETADAISSALATRNVVVGELCRPPAMPGHQDQMTWSVNRRSDILSLLGSVRPVRLLAKADAVWEGKPTFTRNGGTATVLSVEAAGPGTIAELATSTGTYIANGFAVHNTEKAVQAALSAAKEAVKEQTAASEKSITKSETATAEQLKQLGATFTQAINGVGVSISDLKERVSKIESIKQGSFEQRAETSTATSQLLTVIAVIISAAVLGLALYAALH